MLPPLRMERSKVVAVAQQVLCRCRWRFVPRNPQFQVFHSKAPSREFHWGRGRCNSPRPAPNAAQHSSSTAQQSVAHAPREAPMSGSVPAVPSAAKAGQPRPPAEISRGCLWDVPPLASGPATARSGETCLSEGTGLGGVVFFLSSPASPRLNYFRVVWLTCEGGFPSCSHSTLAFCTGQAWFGFSGMGSWGRSWLGSPPLLPGLAWFRPACRAPSERLRAMTKQKT